MKIPNMWNLIVILFELTLSEGFLDQYMSQQRINSRIYLQKFWDKKRVWWVFIQVRYSKIYMLKLKGGNWDIFQIFSIDMVISNLYSLCIFRTVSTCVYISALLSLWRQARILNPDLSLQKISCFLLCCRTLVSLSSYWER